MGSDKKHNPYRSSMEIGGAPLVPPTAVLIEVITNAGLIDIVLLLQSLEDAKRDNDANGLLTRNMMGCV